MVYNSFKILATFLLLAINTYSHAQYSVWKKRVVRKINIAKTSQSQSLEKSQQPDSFLAQMFIEDAVTGKIDVYDIMDFGTKIPISVLTEKPVCVLDTIYIEDPMTGQVIGKPNNRVLEYDKMQNIRIMEEWEYNPILGTTEIKILAIGPIIDRYRDDGSFVGQQTMFWVKYSDAISLIERYDKAHPNSLVAPKIFNDYFQHSTKETPGSLKEKMQARVTRMVDLSQTEDTCQYSFSEYNYDLDTSITFRLVDEIRKGKFNAYNISCPDLSDTLNTKEVNKTVANKIDVDSTEDKDGTITTRYREIDFSYEGVTHYQILEDWKMNANNGKTTVKIIGVAPAPIPWDVNLTLDKKKWYVPIFWVRYDDAKDIINRYEQYHPDNTFAQHIWHDYFKSDIKPQVVR